MLIFVPVKWLSILMAFVVLALSVQPVCATAAQEEFCCAAATACTEPGTHGTDDKPSCEGTCNPFQHCSCCVIAILLPLVSPLTIPVLLSSGAERHNLLPVGAARDMPDSFWQPPRLLTA